MLNSLGLYRFVNVVFDGDYWTQAALRPLDELFGASLIVVFTSFKPISAAPSPLCKNA